MKARKFNRYSTDIPAFFVIGNVIGEHQLYLKDISQGGLCFNAHGGIDHDTYVDINIPFSGKFVNTSGKIAWCQPLDTGQCQLGIMFEKQVSQSDIEKMLHKH